MSSPSVVRCTFVSKAVQNFWFFSSTSLFLFRLHRQQLQQQQNQFAWFWFECSCVSTGFEVEVFEYYKTVLKHSLAHLIKCQLFRFRIFKLNSTKCKRCKVIKSKVISESTLKWLSIRFDGTFFQIKIYVATIQFFFVRLLQKVYKWHTHVCICKCLFSLMAKINTKQQRKYFWIFSNKI